MGDDIFEAGEEIGEDLLVDSDESDIVDDEYGEDIEEDGDIEEYEDDEDTEEGGGGFMEYIGELLEN